MFFASSPELNVNSKAAEEKDENLARWIPRRVLWEDVPECIDVGMQREGFVL